MSRIAFVGLGVMGRPMATNLLAAGHELVVAARRPAALEPLREAGAEVAANVAAAAREVEVVITMLSDGGAVHGVAAEVLESASQGTLLVDMSTISPGEARDLAEKGVAAGVAVLDAPVSGGDAGAHSGTLSIIVGGEPADFERALSIFEVLGSQVTYVGLHGAGQVVKACNQIVVALTIEGLAEALALGRRAGVEPEVILDVLGAGLAGNRVMEVRRENLLSRRFEPGFRVDLHHKDLGIALEEAAAHGATLPATTVVRDLMESLRRQGRGAEDHTALLDAVDQVG